MKQSLLILSTVISSLFAEQVRKEYSLDELANSGTMTPIEPTFTSIEVPAENISPKSEPFQPLNQSQKERGVLLISIPHDDVEVFVNSKSVTPKEGSSSVVLNGLRPGVYEVKSISPEKTDIQMVNIDVAKITEVNLNKLHDRNYFTITPSWSTMVSDGSFAVGPSIDVGMIYDDLVYFGVDWNMNVISTEKQDTYYSGDKNGGLGGMLKVLWYKPVSQTLSFGVGLNTGFYRYNSTGDSVMVIDTLYDNSTSQYQTYEPNKSIFLGGGSMMVIIGRKTIFFRGAYDLLVDTEFDTGHLFKMGVMIKL